jgi:hypothetical protein
VHEAKAREVLKMAAAGEVVPLRPNKVQPEPTIEFLTEEAWKGLDRLGKKVESGDYDNRKFVQIPKAYEDVFYDAIDKWNQDSKLMGQYPHVGIAADYFKGRCVIFENPKRY